MLLQLFGAASLCPRARLQCLGWWELGSQRPVAALFKALQQALQWRWLGQWVTWCRMRCWERETGVPCSRR